MSDAIRFTQLYGELPNAAKMAREYDYHRLREYLEHPGSWGAPRETLVEAILVLLDRIEDE